MVKKTYTFSLDSEVVESFKEKIGKQKVSTKVNEILAEYNKINEIKGVSD